MENYDKALALFHKTIEVLAEHITNDENNLVMQMAVANNDELQAYRDTRLTPIEVRELQKKYEKLREDYNAELGRDIARENSELRYKLENAEYRFSIIEAACHDDFDSDIDA